MARRESGRGNEEARNEEAGCENEAPRVPFDFAAESGLE